MSQFGELYADYYDLLYKDKNYQQEADYVDRLVRKFHPGATTLLDLGCGTGRHAELFCTKGYTVHGIDISEGMLKVAAQRALQYEKGLSFSHSDVKTLQLGQRFDVITALFHVASYQTLPADLNAMFQSVHRHLNEGGLFIFDFWYGPAVLTDLPVVRVKRLESDAVKVTRLAEPEFFPTRNVVTVHYDIFIEDKTQQHIVTMKESHPMRYFFDPELDLICDAHGFETLDSYSWLTESAPDFSSWNALRVVRK